MPDRRRHRGPDPEDARLFAPQACEIMRLAASDLCWLLNRGYALPSALELVGNRYDLVRRQRLAVARCVCTDAALARRQLHAVSPGALRGNELWVDGYNLLNALESALAGGVILRGRDGCFRDMAGTHGGYRQVEETVPALHMLGKALSGWGISRCRWWLDQPVSNSGRLKSMLLDLAAKEHWPWEVELVFSPDKVLAETPQIIATSDSVILDHCVRWFNLARHLIEERVVSRWLIDLSDPISTFRRTGGIAS